MPAPMAVTKVLRTGHDAAIPFAVAIKKGNDGIAARHGTIEHDMGIDADQLSIVVRVTIAGAGSSRLDVAQHRAGIASNGVVFRHASVPFGLR